MYCLQEFHLTLEQWRDMSDLDRYLYLYAMTQMKMKEHHEHEKAKEKHNKPKLYLPRYE